MPAGPKMPPDPAPVMHRPLFDSIEEVKAAEKAALQLRIVTYGLTPDEQIEAAGIAVRLKRSPIGRYNHIYEKDLDRLCELMGVA